MEYYTKKYSEEPVTEEQIYNILKQPIKGSTLRQLSHLSSRLELHGTGGSADVRKSVELSKFLAYLRHLASTDKPEFIKIAAMDTYHCDQLLSCKDFYSELPRPAGHPYHDKYSKYGLIKFIEDTTLGRVCVNDALRPALRVLFENLFLSVDSSETPFFKASF